MNDSLFEEFAFWGSLGDDCAVVQDVAISPDRK